MARRISVTSEDWRCEVPFRINNRVEESFPVVLCEIEQDGISGHGEAMGVFFHGETTESMSAEISGIADAIAEGADRQALLDLLPPGGARFAVDSALWDLDAQLSGISAWETAGVNPGTVPTVFTIGLEAEPGEMAAKASASREYPLLKIKLDDDRPLERMTRIREARPDARLIVDVNQGWSFDELRAYAPQLDDLGVEIIEQPLPRGGDDELEGYDCPVTLCADESCLHLGELADAARRYDMINIKLDKTGGLTHALQLAHDAREMGIRLMVGCMGGTSLCMAPSHVLAQLCEYADIDGPLLIGDDRPGGLKYEAGTVSLPDTRFWGVP